MKYFWHLLKKEMRDKKYIAALEVVVLLDIVSVLYWVIFGYSRSASISIINYRTFLLFLITVMFAYSVIIDQIGNNKYQILSLPLSRFIAPLAKIIAFSFLSFLQELFELFNFWNKMYRNNFKDFLPDGVLPGITTIAGTYALQFTSFAVIGLVCLYAKNIKLAGEIIFASIFFVLISFSIMSISMAVSVHLFSGPDGTLKTIYIFAVQFISGIFLMGIYLFLYEKKGYVQ